MYALAYLHLTPAGQRECCGRPTLLPLTLTHSHTHTHTLSVSRVVSECLIASGTQREVEEFGRVFNEDKDRLILDFSLVCGCVSVCLCVCVEFFFYFFLRGEWICVLLEFPCGGFWRVVCVCVCVYVKSVCSV